MSDDNRTLLQKIEDVLIYLKSKQKPSYLLLEDITPELLRSLNIRKRLIRKLLDKLIKDSYVEYENVLIQNTSSGAAIDFYKSAYKITFEGDFFLESVGGT